MIPIVILAGGLATRLRPLTDNIPKSMLQIAGEPFISHQLRYLKSQGALRVVICLGYLGEQIEKYIESKNRFGLEIIYSYDGKELVGTGGAIKKALPYLPNFFFVQYGDSYLPINYCEIEKYFFLQQKSALMTIYENNNKYDSSNVEYFDGLVIKYSKNILSKEMKYIDYGLGILNATNFDNYPEKFDLSDIYADLATQKKLAGFQEFNRFYEIGSNKGIADTQNFFLMRN